MVPRGPCTFRQRDVTAAVKAVEKAGCAVGRVEVHNDGKIVVVPTIAGAEHKPETELDKWLETHAG
jgi:hypothetical protein